MPASSCMSSHTKLQMLTSWKCACVCVSITEWRLIIKCDLTDDSKLLASHVLHVCTLFSLLSYRNRQLPSLIIIAGPVLSFPFSSLVAVCMCVSFTYTHVIDAPSLTLVQDPLRFNAPKSPLASAFPCTASIKLAIYFMKLSPWTFSRFTVIFMCSLILECGRGRSGQAAAHGEIKVLRLQIWWNQQNRKQDLINYSGEFYHSFIYRILLN